MLIRGVVVAVRVVRNYSKINPVAFSLYFQLFVVTPLSSLCAFKVATELRIHNFTIFATIIIFVSICRQLSSSECNKNNPTCFASNEVFFVKTVLLCLYMSSKKLTLNLGSNYTKFSISCCCSFAILIHVPRLFQIKQYFLRRLFLFEHSIYSVQYSLFTYRSYC